MLEHEIKLIRDEVSDIIIETKEIVADFRDKVELKKAELPNISEIKRQLKEVSTQLNLIKRVTDDIKGLYGELDEVLGTRQRELEGKNYEIITKRKKQFIDLVHANLPDKMNLYEKVDNGIAWNIVLSLAENKEYSAKKKNIEKRHFYEKDQKIIGELMFEETSDELFIKVRIQEEPNYQEFKIENPLRVFPVVTHIITRYNYKEEIE